MPEPSHAALRTRMESGVGAVDRLGDLALELGLERVLLVTDPGVVRAGHADRAAGSLEKAGVAVARFDRVRENPTTEDVDACLAAARKAGVDGFVGLGGGSSLDTAKGANFLLTNGGRMADYWGSGKAAKPLLPMIAVPTTAGTGSEAQSYALIADAATHRKMACGDPKAAPRIALLDPSLTLTLPRAVTAAAGIDTIAHAVEAAVTTRRSALSAAYARDAFTLGHDALPVVLREPGNLDARGNMLFAAFFAGKAVELSMLGAAHAAANPLTARFGIVHGRAVALMLPHVMRFNLLDATARALYAEMARDAGLAPPESEDGPGAEALLARVEELRRAVGPPATLAEAGVPAKSWDDLARDAAGQWTGTFNPRPLGERDFAELYRAAKEGVRD